MQRKATSTCGTPIPRSPSQVSLVRLDQNQRKSASHLIT
jgi:hypothetical protein